MSYVFSFLVRLNYAKNVMLVSNFINGVMLPRNNLIKRIVVKAGGIVPNILGINQFQC